MATTEYEPSRHVKRYLSRTEGLVAEQTHRSRKSALKHFEQWLQAEGIDIMDVGALTIEDYVIDQSKDGHAPGTINKRYYDVKKLYEFLADKLDLIDETPFEGVEKADLSRIMKGTKKVQETREEISYVTPEQVEQLAENVPEPRLRNELMLRMMFQTGVRQGELVGIRIQDIDRDDRSIRIHAEKTSTNRVVYFQPDLDFLLDQWLNGGYRDSSLYADESPYLFVSRQSDQFTDHKVNWMVKEAAENAGIQSVMYEDSAGQERKKITSHALRHGHAVEALKSGIDVRTVQKHLGHASLDMTMKYLRLIDDDVRDAYQRFGG